MTLPPASATTTAVVTGSSSGIGTDLARVLAGRGYGVTLVARRVDRLEALAEELRRSHGVRVEVVAGDLADPSARAALVEAVAARGLTVDILCNNAGLGVGGDVADSSSDRLVGMVRTNVEAVVDLTARWLPGMVERRRGAILNVASTAAFQPLPGTTTYAATKAFVLSFSEGLAAEVKASGVTVTALCPGPVKTEFGEAAGHGDLSDKVPARLWTTSEQVAKAAIDGMAKGKRVVIPGGFNAVGAGLAKIAPHAVLLPLVRRANPLS